MGEEPDTINLPESPLFSVELKTHPIDSKGLPKLFKAQGVPLSKRIDLSNAPNNLTIIIDRDNKQAYALKRDDNLLHVFKFPEIPKLGSSPIVHLKLKDNPQQQLPIWIGEPEAQAINIGMKGTETPRPMTHDLCLNLLEVANAKIRKVVVSDMQENTYIGKMIIDFNGTVKEIDCRPSDAIALAARTKVPIFVAKKVTDQHSYNVTDSERAVKSDSEEK